MRISSRVSLCCVRVYYTRAALFWCNTQKANIFFFVFFPPPPPPPCPSLKKSGKNVNTPKMKCRDQRTDTHAGGDQRTGRTHLSSLVSLLCRLRTFIIALLPGIREGAESPVVVRQKAQRIRLMIDDVVSNRERERARARKQSCTSAFCRKRKSKKETKDARETKKS